MKRSIVMLASAVLLLSATAQAQNSGPIRFQITAGGTNLYKLAIPLPIGDYGPQRLAKMVQEVASNDLSLAGFFRVLDPKAYLANLAAEGLSINPPDWTNIGAAGVIKARVTPFGDNVSFEFRLYDVSQGNQPVLTKSYRGTMANARLLVHQWASDVVKYYTGEDSFFNSRIAFSSGASGRRRDLMVMDWDGAGVHAITNRSQNLMPAWSPSGAELAFTSYLGGKPDLYLIAAGGGRPKLLSARPGLNMGAAFSPDGREICATLSQDGNSELYLLSTAGAIIKRLTHTPFIDTSCSWSPDGKRIAFVSDRFG
ncbi:MAG: Tol-Pal system beta propeller repeat protein TolB, partial [Polyangia bacterium]